MKKVIFIFLLSVMLCEGCTKEDFIDIDSTNSTNITNSEGGYGNGNQETQTQEQQEQTGEQQ